MWNLHIQIWEQDNETDDVRETKQENRCRAEEWSTDSIYNVSTNEQAELRKMEKAGG